MSKRDKELTLAYQQGILDERKEWLEVKKENDLLKYREKKINSFCFCKGDPIWRPLCAECQDWFKSELKRRISIWKKKSNNKIISGSWDGISESLLDLSFETENKHSEKQSKVKQK